MTDDEQELVATATIAVSELTAFLATPMALDASSQVYVRLSKHGLSQTTVDPAHVAMVSSSLKAEAFASYTVLKAGAVVAIPLELVKWLKRVPGIKKTSEVALVFYVSASGKGEVAGRCGTTSASWAFSTADYALVKVPKIDTTHCAKVTVEHKELLQAVKGIHSLKAQTRILWRDDALVFQGYRAGETDGEVVYEHSCQQASGPENWPPSTSIYDTKYLRDVVRTVGNAKGTLWAGNDYPLVTEWRNSNSEVTFLLAPRIEEKP